MRRGTNDYAPDWPREDHAEFERWYGRPVWWKGAPIDAPVVEAVAA